MVSLYYLFHAFEVSDVHYMRFTSRCLSFFLCTILSLIDLILMKLLLKLNEVHEVDLDEKWKLMPYFAFVNFPLVQLCLHHEQTHNPE